MIRKVCVVTGTRAEYGLLFWCIKALQESVNFDLQLVATGMHLSPEFGLTYRTIEADGFLINRKVEMLLSSDSPVGISKSIGLGVIGFADAFAELRPDIVLLLGDRFETLAAATAAMIARLPIAHCHGGETTEGVIDEPIRHSITKMAHLHFTSTEAYRRRVIQLGENPDRVFNVGAPGIENINRLQLLSRADFENSIGFRLHQKNFLVTFHPVTLENATTEVQFQGLVDALNHFPEAGIIFTKANADTDGRIINAMIDAYVKQYSHRAIAHTSLGQLRFLSALKNVDVVIGNSSSGLLEAPLFHIPTVNIGDRQKGRIQGKTVINCAANADSITSAIQQALNDDFRVALQAEISPYDQGNSSEKILQVIGSVNIENIIKKEFYDLPE